MLSYAFQVLNESHYNRVKTEEFENAADLCAAILITGVSHQVKQGLHHEYIEDTDIIGTIRGRINFNLDTMTGLKHDRKLSCTFDDFSENNVLNQILKSTISLLTSAPIDKGRKSALKKLLPFFHNVSLVSLDSVNWNYQFNRNNRTYQMLIGICHLVYKGLLQTQKDGSTYLMDFFDEQRMSHLYEIFLLEYYRFHWRASGIRADSPEIKWQLDDDNTNQLPSMQSDIVLSKEGTYLIMDAKYYGSNMQSYMDKRSIRSAHLYQIFTYVKNKETELQRLGIEHTVSGMLMYAMTKEEVQPDADYSMSGNRISAKHLNLDCPWDEIRLQLDSVVHQYFTI